MTRIQTFDMRDHYDAIEALGQLHKAETEAHLHDLPCSLNREIYDALQEADMLVCVGAFAEDEIIGYAIAAVSPHPHYEMVQANHDSLFIHPDFRTPRLALRMIEVVEMECRVRGASFIAWHAKPQSAFARLISSRATQEEIIYIKEL